MTFPPVLLTPLLFPRANRLVSEDKSEFKDENKTALQQVQWALALQRKMM